MMGDSVQLDQANALVCMLSKADELTVRILPVRHDNLGGRRPLPPPPPPPPPLPLPLPR